MVRGLCRAVEGNYQAATWDCFSTHSPLVKHGASAALGITRGQRLHEAAAGSVNPCAHDDPRKAVRWQREPGPPGG